jgi:hypothetical protein
MTKRKNCHRVAGTKDLHCSDPHKKSSKQTDKIYIPAKPIRFLIKRCTYEVWEMELDTDESEKL